MTYEPKAFRVKAQRVLSGVTYAEAGDVVFDQKGYDYGLASDDTRMTGIYHVSVTKKPDGDYPGFTIPRDDLEPMDRAEALAELANSGAGQ
jgi:hypothetical protein